MKEQNKNSILCSKTVFIQAIWRSAPLRPMSKYPSEAVAWIVLCVWAVSTAASTDNGITHPLHTPDSFVALVLFGIICRTLTVGAPHNLTFASNYTSSCFFWQQIEVVLLRSQKREETLQSIFRPNYHKQKVQAHWISRWSVANLSYQHQKPPFISEFYSQVISNTCNISNTKWYNIQAAPLWT